MAIIASSAERFQPLTRAPAVAIPKPFGSAQDYYDHLKLKLEELLLERQQIMDILMARNSPLHKPCGAADGASRSCRFPSYQLSSAHKLRKYVLRREASRTVDKAIDHLDQKLRLLERRAPAFALEEARLRLRHASPHHPLSFAAPPASLGAAAGQDAAAVDRSPRPARGQQLLKPAFVFKPSNKRFVVSASDESPSSPPAQQQRRSSARAEQEIAAGIAQLAIAAAEPIAAATAASAPAAISDAASGKERRAGPVDNPPAAPGGKGSGARPKSPPHSGRSRHGGASPAGPGAVSPAASPARQEPFRVLNGRGDRPPPMDSESFMSLFNVSIVSDKETPATAAAAAADPNRKLFTISPNRRSRMRSNIRRREIKSNVA